VKESYAAHYYKLAAGQDHPAAQFNYGLILFNGDGLRVNKSLPGHFFKLAADEGHADARFNSGLLLSRRDGIQQDKSLAGHSFKLAADQGHADAQCSYGVRLFNGAGIPTDKSLAADQGGIWAERMNGVLLEKGYRIPTTNHVQLVIANVQLIKDTQVREDERIPHVKCGNEEIALPMKSGHPREDLIMWHVTQRNAGESAKKNIVK
jgi:hypothetical protein